MNDTLTIEEVMTGIGRAAKDAAAELAFAPAEAKARALEAAADAVWAARSEIHRRQWRRPEVRGGQGPDAGHDGPAEAGRDPHQGHRPTACAPLLPRGTLWVR